MGYMKSLIIIRRGNTLNQSQAKSHPKVTQDAKNLGLSKEF
jgi:hypothetical protein